MLEALDVKNNREFDGILHIILKYMAYRILCNGITSRCGKCQLRRPIGERLHNPESGTKAIYKGLQHICGVGFFELPVSSRKNRFKEMASVKKYLASRSFRWRHQNLKRFEGSLLTTAGIVFAIFVSHVFVGFCYHARNTIFHRLRRVWLKYFGVSVYSLEGSASRCGRLHFLRPAASWGLNRLAGSLIGTV